MVDVQAVILVVSFVSLIVLGMPIAFALALAAFLAVLSLGELPAPLVVSRAMTSGIDSFPLLAIPLFIVAGELMGAGGMAARLLDFANSLIGRTRGGLAHVNTVTCMLFGAISGSAGAAVSSVGSIMVPRMHAEGYRRDFAVAITATGATTGLIIPPSNIMIVYAVVAQNVSIAALFLAGVIPGVLLGLLIMAASMIMLFGKSARHTSQAKIAARSDPSERQVLRKMLAAVPSLFLVVIVLGGILGGIFSATEAAAVAVAYAWLLTSLIYREMPLRRLPGVLLRSVKTTGVVFLLIAAGQALAWVLARQQIPQSIADGMLALSSNPLVLLLIVNLTLLVVGTVLDMTPAVLIFTPIFLPVALQLGMDPVQFGIVLIMNLCIGLCTPPVGTCLFIGCGVGNVSMERASHAMIPFWIAMIVALLIVTYIPSVSLFLPRLADLL